MLTFFNVRRGGGLSPVGTGEENTTTTDDDDDDDDDAVVQPLLFRWYLASQLLFLSDVLPQDGDGANALA